MGRRCKIFLALFFWISAWHAFLLADQHVATQLSKHLIHHEYYLPQGPWSIHVLQVQLQPDQVLIETVKAKEQLLGREKTSLLARKMMRKGYSLLAGVNGDYFSPEGIPSGCQVVRGNIIKNPRTNWSVFAITRHLSPFISTVWLNGWVRTKKGQFFHLSGINARRGEDELVLYNSYKGISTHSNIYGTEAILQPINSFQVGDTTLFLVENVFSQAGNTTIASEHFILSGHGRAERFLKSNIATGDTLRLFVSLPPIQEAIYSLVGGTPRIVRDGEVSVESKREGLSDSFARSRHPRTAVGFSRDKKTLYLLTVDGRQPQYSVGMSLFELADFMVSIGAWQALNLDGGGSTTMVIRDSIVNSPSEATGERPVANTLFAIETPKADAPFSFEIIPSVAWLASNSDFTFQVLAPADSGQHARQNLSWSCDPQLGHIRDGRLFVNGKNKSGYVYVQWNGKKDSARVHTLPATKVVVLPPKRTVKVGQTIRLRAVAFADNNIKLSNTSFRWSASNRLGVILPDGRFNAMQRGATEIRASLANAWGTGTLTVEFSE